MEKISVLIQRLNNSKYAETMNRLYVDSKRAEDQTVRYIRALKSFQELYGDLMVEVYSAPGRSEIGGNHTDHQYGQVLAAAVNLDTIAVVSARADAVVKVKSEGYEPFTMDLSNLDVDPGEMGGTKALIRGVAANFRRLGYEIGGFDAYVTSDVLSGSGLSSSAAFEVLIGNVFSGLYNDGRISQVEIAKVSQRAECDYFGKPCGLMDQMASAVGGLVHIDFGNPEEPVIDPVTVDFAAFGHDLCIVDTHGSHADLTRDYADVPAEMKQVAAFFGASVLKQVDEKEFYQSIPGLREQMGDRCVLRAMHWFCENHRVEAQVEALRTGDFDAFKKQIKASGDSSYKYLQNVYSSHKVQAQAVSLAIMISEQLLGDAGVVRVHGGGFAGTIQAFVPAAKTAEYKRGIEEILGEGSCYVLNIRPVGGTRVL